jgi:membrane dipeptidase
MIGIEGGHQTGNSLGALRLFYEMGARYMTITHNCDNAFAMAWTSLATSKRDTGLTSFGRSLVFEMNRLGMMVDLSHVSPQTMHDVLDLARAPLIFSHSGAFTVSNHHRNVQDDVLHRVRGNGGIVMVPMVSYFVNTKHPDEATVEGVVDHIMHIAQTAGWDHVGVGSDFDGTVDVARGIEVCSSPD